MSEKRLIIEGGGSDSSYLKSRCREGFAKLLEAANPELRAFRCIAKGGREEAFKAFRNEHTQGEYCFLALWVDSEDPVADPEQTWVHLKDRDNWERPKGASDEQVMFMATCMETLFVADPDALKEHYGDKFQRNALPVNANLESVDRHQVQDKLVHATRNCKAAYSKDEHSFELLKRIRPEILREKLPSFARTIRLLETHLGACPPTKRQKRN